VDRPERRKEICAMDFPGFVLRYRAVHLVSIAVDGSIAKGLCQTIDLGGRFSSAIALLEGWIQLFDYSGAAGKTDSRYWRKLSLF